jgi:hypothetical protein
MSLTTPFSTAIWVNAVTPDKYDRHTVSILVDNTQAWKTFGNALENWCAEAGTEVSYSSLLSPVGEWAGNNLEGIQTGDSVLRFQTKLFSQNNEHVPIVYNNTRLQDLPREPMSGDILAVRFTPKVWNYQYKTGVSLYLNKILLPQAELDAQPQGRRAVEDVQAEAELSNLDNKF